MAQPLTQLYKGTLELAVLALLARSPKYGGEIIDALTTSGGLATSAGTIYPLLKRLATSGLVTTTWVESPSGPPRKYYELTDAGRGELANLTRAWNELSSALDQLLENHDER